MEPYGTVKYGTEQDGQGGKRKVMGTCKSKSAETGSQAPTLNSGKVVFLFRAFTDAILAGRENIATSMTDEK